LVPKHGILHDEDDPIKAADRRIMQTAVAAARAAGLAPNTQAMPKQTTLNTCPVMNEWFMRPAKWAAVGGGGTATVICRDYPNGRSRHISIPKDWTIKMYPGVPPIKDNVMLVASGKRLGIRWFYIGDPGSVIPAVPYHLE
jgi:hypothetical protein